MTDLPSAVRHCLRRLTTFGGRDTRSQFWFYMLGLFLAQQALSGVAIVALVFGSGLFGGDGPVDPSATSSFHSFIAVMLLLPIFAIALVAAAVTRRLHDSGLRGWWGMMPVPFLLYGDICMYRLFSTFGRPDVQPDERLFASAFLNNAIYLVALLALIVLLVRRSDTNANRFGPPTDGVIDR